MKTLLRKRVLLWFLPIVMMVLYACNQNKSDSNKTVNDTIATRKNSSEGSKLVIMIPENIEEYKQRMTEHMQAGGPDPLKDTRFIEKKIPISSVNNLLEQSANEAAAQIGTGGGPEKARVVYFKKIDRKVYILLNIDLNGWAGVSVAIAEIHPLVEKTLLHNKEVEKVIFDYAPGDQPATETSN